MPAGIFSQVQGPGDCLSGNPSPLPKGLFIRYIHTWQEPASPCAAGTHMKKHGIEGRGSRRWLLDMEMAFSLSTDFKWQLNLMCAQEKCVIFSFPHPQVYDSHAISVHKRFLKLLLSNKKPAA